MRSLGEACAAEEESAKREWNDTRALCSSLQEFSRSYLLALRDLVASAEDLEELSRFREEMQKKLHDKDAALWEAIQARQRKSLAAKRGFFAQRLFERLSQGVFESFQTLCLLELRRLHCLFNGVRRALESKDFSDDAQAHRDFGAQLEKFLKGGLTSETLY